MITCPALHKSHKVSSQILWLSTFPHSRTSKNKDCERPCVKMAQKCVHKGCGKVFTDPEEECVYHPGPPEFHEGQKGKNICCIHLLRSCAELWSWTGFPSRSGLIITRYLTLVR